VINFLDIAKTGLKCGAYCTGRLVEFFFEDLEIVELI